MGDLVLSAVPGPHQEISSPLPGIHPFLDPRLQELGDPEPSGAEPESPGVFRVSLPGICFDLNRLFPHRFLPPGNPWFLGPN